VKKYKKDTLTPYEKKLEKAQELYDIAKLKDEHTENIISVSDWLKYKDSNRNFWEASLMINDKYRNLPYIHRSIEIEEDTHTSRYIEYLCKNF
jgi:hypothetical protein